MSYPPEPGRTLPAPATFLYIVNASNPAAAIPANPAPAPIAGVFNVLVSGLSCPEEPKAFAEPDWFCIDGVCIVVDGVSAVDNIVGIVVKEVIVDVAEVVVVGVVVVNGVFVVVVVLLDVGIVVCAVVRVWARS